MSEADKAEAKANQDTFFGVISNWKSANSGKQPVSYTHLNGVDYSRNYLTHGALLNGGTLRFDMGSQPNMKRGTDVYKRQVEKVDFLSLMGVCEDTMQLNTLLQTEQPDLLFLDIEMPRCV